MNKNIAIAGILILAGLVFAAVWESDGGDRPESPYEGACYANGVWFVDSAPMGLGYNKTLDERVGLTLFGHEMCLTHHYACTVVDYIPDGYGAKGCRPGSIEASWW